MLTFLRLSMTDAESISSRIHSWWMEIYSGEISSGAAGLESIFAREETPAHIVRNIEGGTEYYDVCLDGKVIGMIAYRIDGDTLYIDKLYLDGPMRHSGYGGECLEYMLSAGRSAGCMRARLHVSPGNRSAYDFYLMRGFVLDFIEDITDAFGVTGERHHLVKPL